MRTRFCESAALPPGKALSATLDGLRVAVFRLPDGSLHGLEDRCPHRGAPLSEGILYEEFVACRDHGWSICLRDGKVAAPEQGSVRTFAVMEADGLVWVTLDE